MEAFEEKWARTEDFLKARFGKLPDMEGILFLVGVNELGRFPEKTYSKEQKQDLMHIAVCSLLSRKGYYRFTGNDEEGWPHYEAVAAVEATGIATQERLLKECLIEYFEN
jgi:hypothetical protein